MIRVDESKWGPVKARTYLESKANRYVEAAGWIGFAMGVLFTSLLFVFAVIPNLPN